MSTPLPLGLAPYISPTILLNGADGRGFSRAGPRFRPEMTSRRHRTWPLLWDICARATARCDGYLNQTLRATTDIELVRGPDYRVTTGPAAGGAWPTPYWGNTGAQNARIILSRWPVLQVTGVQTCPNGVWPRAVDLASGRVLRA